jgi:RNA polymerase sigma-54 factor
MLLADIAKKLSLHESTISRAIRDKYMQCTWGIYPLNFFFSKGIASGSAETKVTPSYIQDQIAAIIQEEDRKKPLSDQKISHLLAEHDIHISRRTVAKYRAARGIKDAGGRKEYFN